MFNTVHTGNALWCCRLKPANYSSNNTNMEETHTPTYTATHTHTYILTDLHKPMHKYTHTYTHVYIPNLPVGIAD